MARKKKHAEHVNHERWLVSYADFITLLFAFFVVMFAASNSDQKKAGQIATAVQVAFKEMAVFSPSGKVVPLYDTGGLPGLPHFAPKAKRVIYLFQSGAPSQIDLFDPKPAIAGRRGVELPDSVRMGQRITTMTSGQIIDAGQSPIH